MASNKQREAARENFKPTRAELEAEARELDISGRSRMGKAELKRAVGRAKD